MTVLRWLKRNFITHPHGACRHDGCDRPRMCHWIDWCEEHWTARLREAKRAEADRRFEYDVRVAVEAMRRREEATR